MYRLNQYQDLILVSLWLSTGNGTDVDDAVPRRPRNKELKGYDDEE